MPGGGSALLYCRGLGSFACRLPAARNCKRELVFFVLFGLEPFKGSGMKGLPARHGTRAKV